MHFPPAVWHPVPSIRSPTGAAKPPAGRPLGMTTDPENGYEQKMRASWKREGGRDHKHRSQGIKREEKKALQLKDGNGVSKTFAVDTNDRLAM